MASSTRRSGSLYEESGNKRVLKVRHLDNQEDEDSQTAAGTQYSRGAVKSMCVRNFMVSVKFDPQFNVFVSPNGTGKSSIVCALCIGLGGKPMLLARQSRLSEFVRRGYESAFIEIIVSGGGSQSDTRISRIIHADKETSEWNIDGCPAALRDIEQFMKSMNIQLNNLLQFMPQDRVSEFASLTPVRLLEETERAIDPDLFERHQSIGGMERTLGNNNSKIRNLENDLKRVTALMRTLERDVERLQQVAVLTKEATQIDAKLSLLSIEKIKDDLKSSAEDLQRGEEIIRSKKVELRTLSNQLLEHRKKSGELQSVCSELKMEIDEKERCFTELNERINKEEDLIEDKILELQDLAAESAKLKEKIEALKGRVSMLETEVEQNPRLSDDVKRRTEQLNRTCTDRMNQMQSVQNEIDGIERSKNRLIEERRQTEAHLKRLDNTKLRLVQMLERRRPLFRGLAHAYEVLKQHQDRFQMPVIGPLITEVTARDKKIAQYLENHVPLTTWTLFIVRCDDDMKMLRSLQLMRELNVINLEDDGNEPFVGPDFQSNLSQFGVSGCLSDYFEAPHIVKHVIHAECAISGVFVGTEEAGNHVMNLFGSDRRIRRLFTPSQSYTCTRSRYASTFSVSTAQLREADLLGKSDTVPVERVQLERKIEEIEENLHRKSEEQQTKQQQYDDFFNSYKEAKQEREDINQQKKEAERRHVLCTRRLKETLRDLQRMQALPDPLTMETERKHEISSLQNRMLEIMHSMQLCLQQHQACYEKYSVKSSLLKEVSRQCATVQTRSTMAGRRLDEQRRVVDHLRSTFKDAGVRLRTAECQLNRKFPDIEEWTTILEALPTSREQLEDMASEKRYQAATLTCNNPDAMTSYDQLKSEVASLEAQLEASKSEYEQAKRNVDRAKRTWMSKLKPAVGRINDAFVDNLLAIGCGGQVSLQGEEVHGHAFQNYALEIKVQFRATETLKVLDSVRQSGGERVVATTLYLLSLQAVSQIPFRVMDEINHGMDEENERRVMDILASKMFSNPEFLKKATCFMIKNGRIIVSQRA